MPTILEWVNGELDALLAHTDMVLKAQKVRSSLGVISHYVVHSIPL